MSFTINSTNMLLPIPIVGVEPGPQYATDINSCLTIIDTHNHTPGYGVAIPSDGLDINADLPFNDNNLTEARSIRFQSQGAPLALGSDLGCLYEVNDDLYFNDGLGNQIRLTQSGGVAGTPGSIANLTPPASASYVALNQTFVFQSASLTPANIDGASFILRNLAASSKGLTLQPPSAMAADYSITLPSLPASTLLMTMTSAGVQAANVTTDNVTTQIQANLISVKNGYITYEFKLNGVYSGLTTPALGIDGLCFFNFNATIVNVWCYITAAGASGSTEIDLKVATAPGAAFNSILSTPAEFDSTAGAYAYVDANGVVAPGTGVTAPVLSTTSINAGSAMRFDLLSIMAGTPEDVGVIIQFKQR